MLFWRVWKSRSSTEAEKQKTHSKKKAEANFTSLWKTWVFLSLTQCETYQNNQLIKLNFRNAVAGRREISSCRNTLVKALTQLNTNGNSVLHPQQNKTNKDSPETPKQSWRVYELEVNLKFKQSKTKQPKIKPKTKPKSHVNKTKQQLKISCTVTDSQPPWGYLHSAPTWQTANPFCTEMRITLINRAVQWLFSGSWVQLSIC